MPESALEYVDVERPGEFSRFTCPECSGPLYEIQAGDLARFRCRVGHAFTAESMLYDKFEELEKALYAALDTLEESALMADRLPARSHEHRHGHAVARYEKWAEDARQQAKIIRQVLTEDTLEAV